MALEICEKHRTVDLHSETQTSEAPLHALKRVSAQQSGRQVRNLFLCHLLTLMPCHFAVRSDVKRLRGL